MVKLKERVRNLFILLKKNSHFKSNEIDFKGYNLLSLQNGYKVLWNALWRRSRSISKAIYKGKHYRSKSESNKVLFAKILTCHSSKNAFYLIKSVSLLLEISVLPFNFIVGFVHVCCHWGCVSLGESCLLCATRYINCILWLNDIKHYLCIEVKVDNN